MKTISDQWVFSRDKPSDLTVVVGEVTFNLHKLPLISKSGYINKLVSESNDSKVPCIRISDAPGGAEAFELAARFCYRVNFEITTENVAALRCIAEYLEMTEAACADGNLIGRAEAYLEEVALASMSGAVAVLHKSEELVPMAEKVKLVSRCIDAVAYIACSSQTKSMADWWADELTVLRIDTFQRVLVAMKARGFKEYALGPLIMLYAQKSLRSLIINSKGRRAFEPKEEHEKRVVLETIVGLLPRERNAISVSFLSMLLRAAICLDTTIACRLDLEKRMAMQLGQAALDDLLVPSSSSDSTTAFDVDTVQRILTNYLEHEAAEGSRSGFSVDDDCISTVPGDMEQVGRLMESYIAEIASDQNLIIDRFVGLAELIPERARFNEDGMYRAIDIYLKAHPSMGELERKTVCRLMDCQKLSREACAHAAQNDRLPAQTVVQVLHYEQQRFRYTLADNLVGRESPAPSCGSRYSNVPDELSRLQRENDALRSELSRMKSQLNNEAGNHSRNRAVRPASGKPPLPKKSFIDSVSKKLSRLYLFPRSDSVKPGKAPPSKPPKDRRHSIS